MPDRREQIIMLLESRYDLLWFPSGQTFTKGAAKTSKAQRRPARLKPCERCGGSDDPIAATRGTGQIRDRFGRTIPCPDCGGDGQIPWDDYTNEPVATGEDQRPFAEQFRDAIVRDTRTVKCPDCQGLDGEPTGVIRGRPCRRCRGTGQAAVAGSWLSTPRTHELDDVFAPLETAIDRRNEAGSYHDLDLALAGIAHHVNKPVRFVVLTANAARTLRLLDELYLESDTHPRRAPASLSLFEDALHQLALDYLDWRMPDPIRVPADVRANHREREQHLRRVRGRGSSPQALAQRDKEIRRQIRQGTPTQWVAREFGLTVNRVNRIAAGDTEDVA